MKPAIKTISTTGDRREQQNLRIGKSFTPRIGTGVRRQQKMKSIMNRTDLVRVFGPWKISIYALVLALSWFLSVPAVVAQVSSEASQNSASEGASDALKGAAPGLETQRDELQDVSEDLKNDATKEKTTDSEKTTQACGSTETAATTSNPAI
jgi:hypothetical protein